MRIAAAAVVVAALFQVLPLSASAMVVFDNGAANVGPSVTPLRPSGLSLGGVGGNEFSADDFTLALDAELGRVTFQAYQLVGSAWDNLLDYRISLNNAGVPEVAAITGGSGSDVPVTELARNNNGGANFSINSLDYELVTYAFDLGGVGVTAATTYWLVLNAGITTGPIPGAMNLIWAFNSQPEGGTLSANGTSWLPPSFLDGGLAFDISDVPVPSTLLLIAAGLLGAHAARRQRRTVA